MKLSIVIACFNEERTLPVLLERVLAAPPADVAKEVIVVDDGSTDRSPAIAAEFVERFPGVVQSVRMPTNRGKGASMIEGFRHATGDVVLTQDADLEYDPGDYPAILAKFSDPAVQVVYGSRILGGSRASYRRYYWGGRLLTAVTNLLYGVRLTDEPTGYKAFRKEVLDKIPLVHSGFEFCPEVTAKVLRRGYKIHEVPVHYEPRSFEEGKKIRWIDGLVAIWTLLRYRWH
jgi:glycosyltransferase involved in cell wall biosynthesis